METAYKLKNIRAKLSKNKIFYHLLFWVMFISYYGLMDIANGIKHNINWLGYSLGMTVFYTVSLFIMPYFFEKKRYLVCIFGLLLLFIFYNLSMLLILYFQTDFSNFFLYINTDTNDLLKNTVKNLKNFNIYTSYGTIFWIFGFIKRQYQEKEQIENENYAIEKNFLNGQINQHFLYNMLNLFYVKASNYSDYLANNILTFSELLRYSLKDDNRELVLIDDEIEVVRKMLALLDSQVEKIIISRLSVENLPNNFRIPSNMLIHIYQKLLTNTNTIVTDFVVFISYSNERLQIKVNYVYKIHEKSLDFTLLKERLNLIYDSNYLFKETQMDNKFELIISLPHINL